jgi:multidrug efflux pump subunit AcrA (membrane-fusion protein)
MKPHSKSLKYILPLLILGLGAAGFTYQFANRPEPVKPEAKEKVWRVETITAQPQSLSPYLVLYGETETPALLQAAAPDAGLVTELAVRKGDSVSQGQLLITLDPRDYELTIEQAEADVLDLEAQLDDLELSHQSNLNSLEKEKQLLDLAKSEVEREGRLRKKNLSAESALDEARNALGKQELSVISRQSEVRRYAANRKQLEARLSRNRAKLAEAKLAFERSQVTAPFDGVIADVPLAVGDRVQKGTILVSLYPAGELEVRARIPVQYQGEIQSALDSTTKLTASSDFSGQQLSLSLKRLAGEADPSGIDGFFSVDANADKLRLGNLLKLHFQRPLLDGVVPVPFQAIYGNNRVYLLKEGRMHGVDVEAVGQFVSHEGVNNLLIRSPELAPGEQIVRTHLPNATSGLKVEAVKP